MVRRELGDRGNPSGIQRGLLNGILIAIPLWIILAIVGAMVFRHGPIDEAASAVLMIALVLEAILARPYARALLAKFERYAPFRRSGPGREDAGRRTQPVRRSVGVPSAGQPDEFEKLAGGHFQSIYDLLRHVERKSAPPSQVRSLDIPASLIRQSLALSALVGAYLHYYFIEVSLQISSLNSVAVFVPVRPLG